MRTIVALSMLAVLCLGPSLYADGPYQAKWDSLDSRPIPAWYPDAKFGIFIHWGVYSVPSWSVRGEYAEWYWHNIEDKAPQLKPWREFHDKTYGANFSYMDFAPQFHAELFDPDQWAQIFKDSGARYIALTSKHHDGFCLWPNKQADVAWGRPWNAAEVGPKRDLLGELTTAVRKAGLKMGIYYSLYEWYNPIYLKDRKKYVDEHMFP